MADIVIRRAVADDCEAVHSIYSQPNAVAGTLQLPHSSVEIWKRRLDATSETNVSLVAVCENQIVGSIGMYQMPQVRRQACSRLGMGVHDDWAGRGVGSKMMQGICALADNWYNYSRLELTVYIDNAPAIALYKKFGFTEEGRLTRYAFRNGEFVDALAMARLR